MNLKTLNIEQLNLILHNMRIYGVNEDKRQEVINEINNRNDASNK